MFKQINPIDFYSTLILNLILVTSSTKVGTWVTKAGNVAECSKTALNIPQVNKLISSR